MRKFEDFMRKMWLAIVTFLGAFAVWCSARATGIKNWWNARHHVDEEFVLQGSNSLVTVILPRRRPHIHIHGGIPYIVILIVVIWANKQGLFKDYEGLQALVDIFLHVVDQLCQFSMRIVTELVEHLNVSQVWNDFQTWFWTHWMF